ncbi:hypothetical protein VN97_g6768 [Penicillium thymicola]|uniref:Uncharacterized protein n=1 Tax=Penicillium thymicola TaxID=293382 RepID=A0AAI9X7R1_PENTH|nr:hypothetical protein VN97_g6768 [Penicillium thymicola]
MSLWGPPGEDYLPGCGGVGDGIGAVQLRRVAMLQDRKETSRDTYLLTINATYWYSSHLYRDNIPQLIEINTVQLIGMHIVIQEWNGVFLVDKKK